MKQVDNFTVAYEPRNKHWVFYTNGIGEFTGTWFQFDGVEIKPQAGDTLVDAMILEHEAAFMRVGSILSIIAKNEPEILHENGGQIWWNGKDTLKIHRLDDPGTEVSIKDNGGYEIYEFSPEIH